MYKSHAVCALQLPLRGFRSIALLLYRRWSLVHPVSVAADQQSRRAVSQIELVAAPAVRASGTTRIAALSASGGGSRGTPHRPGAGAASQLHADGATHLTQLRAHLLLSDPRHWTAPSQVRRRGDLRALTLLSFRSNCNLCVTWFPDSAFTSTSGKTD